MLFMTKADIPVLALHLDNTAKVSNLSLVREGPRTCLTMSASEKPGRWEHVIYAGSDGGNFTTGEMYVDINFDGHFDTKHIFDDTGKRISSSIYYNNIWEPVDCCDFQKAVSGNISYRFSEDTGWQIAEVKE